MPPTMILRINLQMRQFSYPETGQQSVRNGVKSLTGAMLSAGGARALDDGDNRLGTVDS